MDKIYDKCCCIDVHQKLIVVCFRCGKKQEIREFGATTKELLALTDWSKEGGCEMVAMESTASYWKSLYNIFESSDLPAMVVNAYHMKAVPERKTDVKDAEWIADLLQHGLLQPSYIPGKDQCIVPVKLLHRTMPHGENRCRLQLLFLCLIVTDLHSPVFALIYSADAIPLRFIVGLLLMQSISDSIIYGSLFQNPVQSFVNVAMFVWSLSLYNTNDLRCLSFYAKSRTCSFIVFK